MQKEQIASAFADGVRTKWASSIHIIRKPVYKGVEEWLLKGNYNWIACTPKLITLGHSIRHTDFTEALASEISRFSCAAYESLMDAEPSTELPKSLGWQCIRHYYAAFYIAHALLRITGSSLTYISGSTASTMSKVAGQYLGVAPHIASGLYLLKRGDIDQDTVTLQQLSTGGGSHQDMWRTFLQLLVNIEAAIVGALGQIPSAMKAIEISGKLRKTLCKHGNNDGGWTSTVRNAINYRQDYGVWYPYTKKTAYYQQASKRLSRWRPTDPNGFDIEPSGGELEGLADVCSVLSQLLITSLKDISARAPDSRTCFVDRGALKFLRQSSIKF
ncbi:hypothetical protein FHG55_23055 [Pseudomonas jessenii]|uniref:Uncharacterized protein n=1 Tax=Pseudomonas jessenii TaxID=77298 RepID=A0A5C4KTC1_PSEJE|nr:hypothetical protein [Pseudomonas jessenii]TNB92237.1 hypothetical protein FHG55_23055 [Pseudomonas jessenii]